MNVTVNPIPNTNVSANGNTNICPGNTVTLIAALDNNNTYQWAVDAPNSICNQQWFIGGCYGYYTVTAVNSFNCSATSYFCLCKRWK